MFEFPKPEPVFKYDIGKDVIDILSKQMTKEIDRQILKTLMGEIDDEEGL